MRSENHSSFAIDCIEVLRFYVPQNNIRKRFIGLRVIRSMVLFLSGIHPSELNVGNGRTFRIVVHNNNTEHLYSVGQTERKALFQVLSFFRRYYQGRNVGTSDGQYTIKEMGCEEKI